MQKLRFAKKEFLIFLFGFLLALLSATWRLDKSRCLLFIVVVFGVFQTLLSCGLYLMTIYNLSEIKRFVLGPGFWSTFGDALVYFNKGLNLSKTGFSAAAEHPSSALFVLLINLSTHGVKQPEIGGIMLNGLLHLTLIPCAYYFLMKSKNEKIGIWGALGIGLMSSGYLYSSQVLRDPLIWVMVIILLGCLINVASQMSQKASSPKNINIALYFGILCATALLTEMRVWLPICVIISLSLAMIANFCETRKPSYSLLGAIACLLSGFVVGLQKPASSFSMFLDKEKIAKTKILETYTPSKNLEKDNNKKHNFLSKSLILRNCTDIVHTSTLALERIREKTMRLRYDWKSLGMAFLLFDIIGLAFWKKFIEQNKKIDAMNNKQNPFSKNPSNIILISLIIEIIIVSAVYSDSVGNLPRYIFPAIVCLVLLVAQNSNNQVQSA